MVTAAGMGWHQGHPAAEGERSAASSRAPDRGDGSRVRRTRSRAREISYRVSTDQLPTLEERIDDVLTVVEAIRSMSATLSGHSEGGMSFCDG